MYTIYLNQYFSSTDLPVEHRLEALQCAILMLPDENREVLMVLLTFLADVAANSHLNQVSLVGIIPLMILLIFT